MKILCGITVLLGVLYCWQQHQLYSMAGEQAALTMRLDDATTKLNKEIERGERIEQATVRLEQADALRRQELRRYERDLSELHDSDVEIGAALDARVPDTALRGLRTCPIAGPRCDPRD